VSSRKGELRQGLRYLRDTSEVAWTVVLVAIIGIFGLNMPVILSAFADTEFRLGVGGYSVFNSLTAIGALGGAIVSARRSGIPRLRTLATTLTVLGVSLAAASFAPWVWLFGAILVACGVCTLLFLTGANSLVQTTAPAWVRGRVMSIYILVLLGGQAIGGPLCGRLIDAVGARPSMLVAGLLVATSTLISGLAMGRKSHLRLRVGGPGLVHIEAR
jgi:MFS family permease